MVVASIAAGVVVLSIAARAFLQLGFSWQCPVLAITGLPCPSCGSTRALAALSQLDLRTAAAFNPLFVLAAPCAVLCVTFRGRLGAYSQWGWPVFFTAVLLNWLYLLCFLPR
ncbi:MAG TPA: DUF2752 domain-containing protein [Verrucomicrobiae bacterium]|nr:DUF2752 domain-containing protein [Verrucomicrobiae bacterium]